MRRHAGIGFFLIFIVFIYSCNKSAPSFPDEPFLEFRSVSKDVATELDTFWVNVYFEDGDGDLGIDNSLDPTCGSNFCDLTSDSSCYRDPYWNAFLIDMRDSCFALLNLPDMEQQGNIKAISGQLSLLAPPVFCKNFDCPDCTTDTLVYSVVIKDRAQHYSNAVLTTPIIIECN